MDKIRYKEIEYGILSDGNLMVLGIVENVLPTSMEIPSDIEGRSVTQVADRAFDGETGIEKVILPKTIQKIDGRAFYGCSNLQTVIIESPYLVKIGREAFAFCTLLETFSCKEIELIGEAVFYECLSLVNFMTDVRGMIPKKSFYGCCELTKFEFLHVVAVLGQSFYGCHKLNHIYVHKDFFIKDAFQNLSNVIIHCCSKSQFIDYAYNGYKIRTDID